MEKMITQRSVAQGFASGMAPSYLNDMILEADKHPEEPPKEPTGEKERRLFCVKTGEEWCRTAAERPDPEELWHGMWYEGETCCLFADSNLGKSIYAVQIAQHIAKSQRVIYFDFELSDKQFQLRYSDDRGAIYPFHKNFMRAEIDTTFLMSGFEELEKVIISEIEDVCVNAGADVAIIDNLSFLCNSADKSDMAGRLMMQLMDLKKRRNFSLLVLAHTPKRSLSSPITQNDLAGSKKLFNFFDSVFTIGRSAKDENLRYIKQLKARAGEVRYGGDNVIMAEIEKEGSFLRFSSLGFSTENEHLKNKNEELDDLAEEVKRLRAGGLSISEVAQRLNISRSKVQRLVAR